MCGIGMSRTGNCPPLKAINPSVSPCKSNLLGVLPENSRFLLVRRLFQIAHREWPPCYKVRRYQISAFDMWLVVKNKIQQGFMHFDVTVVGYKA
jgi:hypothetical protein